MCQVFGSDLFVGVLSPIYDDDATNIKRRQEKNWFMIDYQLHSELITVNLGA